MFLKNLGNLIKSAVTKSVSFFRGEESKPIRTNTVTATLQSFADNIRSDIVINLIEEFGEASPADTSKLVSNWQASLNVPAGVIDAHVPGKKGSTKGQSLGVAIRNARQILASADENDTIFVSNQVEYLRYQSGLVAEIPGIIASVTDAESRKIEFSIND